MHQGLHVFGPPRATQYLQGPAGGSQRHTAGTRVGIGTDLNLIENYFQGASVRAQEPPPDPNDPEPIRELLCLLYEPGGFGEVRQTQLMVKEGLFENTTFLQLKARLQVFGVRIALRQMKIMCGGQEFGDTQLLRELRGKTVIKIEKDYAWPDVGRFRWNAYFVE